MDRLRAAAAETPIHRVEQAEPTRAQAEPTRAQAEPTRARARQKRGQAEQRRVARIKRGPRPARERERPVRVRVARVASARAARPSVEDWTCKDVVGGILTALRPARTANGYAPCSARPLLRRPAVTALTVNTQPAPPERRARVASAQPLWQPAARAHLRQHPRRARNRGRLRAKRASGSRVR